MASSGPGAAAASGKPRSPIAATARPARTRPSARSPSGTWSSPGSTAPPAARPPASHRGDHMGEGEVQDGVPLTNLDQPLFDGAQATNRDLGDYLDARRVCIIPE